MASSNLQMMYSYFPISQSISQTWIQGNSVMFKRPSERIIQNLRITIYFSMLYYLLYSYSFKRNIVTSIDWKKLNTFQFSGKKKNKRIPKPNAQSSHSTNQPPEKWKRIALQVEHEDIIHSYRQNKPSLPRNPCTPQ